MFTLEQIDDLHAHRARSPLVVHVEIDLSEARLWFALVSGCTTRGRRFNFRVADDQVGDAIFGSNLRLPDLSKQNRRRGNDDVVGINVEAEPFYQICLRCCYSMC